ncbi:M48 family metallopeptidase [Sphaerotilus mobilis]|uniref:Peptidase M48-like protein n=1 Tax=Sphaerotilus mobilis TaxID=47994 RepID=A0A4Q7LG08_9BURK|nr:M48 family metallopeptidase [Sphaerotilus mobilis]RZS52268.1 peptidase M48-like protein [Sphaerotilus mobilis]
MDQAPALLYDGRSPRARAVRLRIDGDRLHAEAADAIDAHDTPSLNWPLAGLRWPERQRHGPRQMDLPDGASLQSVDPQAWDALARQAGQRDSRVVRLQQSWRGTCVALLLVLLAVAGLQRWGVPAAASGITALLPPSIDRTLGERTLAALDGQMFQPSRVDAAAQARLQRVMAEVLARLPPGRASADAPAGRLLLRDAGREANAWALPDGSIVVSDAMVALILQDTAPADVDAMLVGLLGHELGHVHRRHGLTMLVQASLTTAFGTLVFGDASGLLASAPLLLGQLAWSREAEREADLDALAQLRAHGLSGEPMAVLLERLHGPASAAGRADAGLLSSHPDHAERIAGFRQAR